jgi:hypothetical protein
LNIGYYLLVMTQRLRSGFIGNLELGIRISDMRYGLA